MLGQLLFRILEEDVTDDDNLEAKGEGMCDTIAGLGEGRRTVAHELARAMMEPDPAKRLTVDQALAHPYFKEGPTPFSPRDVTPVANAANTGDKSKSRFDFPPPIISGAQ